LPGLHTSLAHCGGMVAVALCEGGPVGVDVERRDTASLRPIADLVCAPGEAEALQQADIDRDARLLEHWVRKEAVLKALGLGLARPMASFQAPEGGRFGLRDAQGARVELEVHAHAHSSGYVAALALPADAGRQWTFLTP
jgi:4'-phosphopantetheinyl transferase